MSVLMDALPVLCASCGHENPDGARFCAACGAALGSESPADVRKTVTVVFCDLVGSTALGERTDPELMRELMSRYHAELRTVVARHGGTIEKFVGDAAMAIFGLPQVHEDDAIRAVRAAIAMRAAVAKLDLHVRIGINTGEVVAGSGETLATGDAVNVAARLEQAAGADEILVGSVTEGLARAAVRTEPVPPLELKGKREPVVAYRVLELLDDVPAFTRPIDAPFVGREHELQQLEAALATAVEARAPQLATIVGPPGIGKSRLARELLGRTDARVLVGRCLSYGEGITYWPLREIASQVGDIRAALGNGSEAELAAARIDAALGTVETTASPEEIAWGYRKLFEALAERTPLMVVFDDIHWAEPPLLDLIEYVLTFAQDAPLFILCTARPDLFDSRASWAAPKPSASLLTLVPLSETDSEQLVVQLRDVSAAARARIVEAAEGNPLFVEQLVAMQAESSNGELEVPPSLQALLSARIDRLPDAERAIVERGAVEGRLFHRGAVSALLPDTQRGDVGTHLLALVRKELILPDRAILPGDDGFRFRHILIRDAAYEAIPMRQRAVLHHRYADWLVSSLGAEAPDEIVGYHLEQAYLHAEAMGSADSSVGERAADRLAGAAQSARSRRDAAASVNFLERAVRLVPTGPRRAPLLAALGKRLHEAGDLTRAGTVLEEAASQAREAQDEHAEWLARLELADLLLETQPEGGAERAFREAEAAIEARGPAGDDEVLAYAWLLISDAHNMRAQLEEHGRALEQALTYARRAADLMLEVTIATRPAPLFVWGPTPVADGLRYVDDLLARLGHVPLVQEFALHVRGHMRARRGEFDGAFEAIASYRQGIRELGNEAEYELTANCAWDVCFWAEAWARGEEALREAYERSKETGRKTLLSMLALELGEAAYRQGRLEEADHYGKEAEDLSASDDLVNQASWRALRAKVLAARGELADAERLVRDALELAGGMDFTELTADVWLALARILRDRDETGAREAAGEALALYERKGNLVGAQWARRLFEPATASA
jgi:class 3 adenylate cyclase/tetratricopeptide (TPR) repeat protein